MNDKDQERDEVEMILPGGQLAELQARAAKRGCTIEKLIDEVVVRTRRLPRLQLDALLLRVAAIDEALSRHEPPPWPSDFDQCLEASLMLAGFIQNESEEYLLGASGEEMDVFDAICRETGKSYEEIVRDARQAHLNGEAPDDVEDHDDEGEKWKQ
jgi:hypothetical protein